jgi:hypothetical protein
MVETYIYFQVVGSIVKTRTEEVRMNAFEFGQKLVNLFGTEDRAAEALRYAAAEYSEKFGIRPDNPLTVDASLSVEERARRDFERVAAMYGDMLWEMDAAKLAAIRARESIYARDLSLPERVDFQVAWVNEYNRRAM